MTNKLKMHHNRTIDHLFFYELKAKTRAYSCLIGGKNQTHQPKEGKIFQMITKDIYAPNIVL